MARRAGIAKATAFEWRKRFKNGGEHNEHGEHIEEDGGPDDGAGT